jgi:hypothetical protein
MAAVSLVVVGGCGKSSSTDSGAEETTTATATACSTKICTSSNDCEGTYSALSCTGKVWTGVCKVKQIDVGDWTKIWFETPQANCGFSWIRAQGSVASDWIALASGSSTEAMVESKGVNVFQFRICTNGVNADNTRCL